MTKSIARFVGGLFLIASTIGAGAGVGIALATAGPAGAVVVSPLLVDDAVDHAATASNCTTPVANMCTLRDAVAAANGAGVDVTITLPALTGSNVYNVDSAFGQIDISGGHTVTINGGGANNTILEATSTTSINNRVLKVEQGTIANITGVTVEHGNPSGGIGGGILDCGTLLLNNSTVTENTASSSGGGIELSAHGSATLTTDSITDNRVTSGFPFSSETVSGGGIAINNSSATTTEDLTLDGTTVNGNEGVGNGGGIVTFNTSGTSLDPNLTVNINNSTISDNLINDGEGSSDVYGAGLSPQDGVWNVTGTTITANGPLNEAPIVVGGGVNVFTPGLSQTETFSNDTITGNDAYVGGGVVLDGGTTTISNSTIDGNTASEAFYGVLDETSFSDGGAATIISSTISNNHRAAVLLGETPFLGSGGGVSSLGCNNLDLTNDTITGNVVPNEGGGYFGAECGITAGPQASVRTAHQAQPHITTSGSTRFLFDTIDGNTTGDSNGGGNIQLGSTIIADHSTVTLQNTIVANGIVGTSPTTNCSAATGATIASAGYNLIDDSTCGTPAGTDIIGKNPLLGALGNNGGPTQTEVPGTGSPAIGGIPSAVCSGTGIATDQRGNPRGTGLNGSCTIGAVEVVAMNPNGYRMVGNEGGIFDFGLDFNGSLANNHLNAPIVGIANSPGPNGYLMAGGDGGVFALGGANFFGSLGGQAIPSPIAAIAATPSEDGYWLASQTGTIYQFGNTPTLPAVQLPTGAHIVGMASTNDGKGLWLVDQLGDVYTAGDALYEGGLGGVTINAPIVGIAAAATGQGYVLVGADGGVFCYGVPFHGSVPGSLMPGQHLVAPIVGIAVTHSGNGYWVAGADGGVFNYGDAPFLGSIYTAIGNTPLNGPIVGIQHLGSA